MKFGFLKNLRKMRKMYEFDDKSLCSKKSGMVKGKMKTPGGIWD